MVCPTCFCTTVEDVSDVTGTHAERWRKWDSCFTQNFSYIHGGSVRSSAKSRYRQWMTHKLASWIDQFGSSGCVGCGRCITWCPVGIDITEEVRAIRECGSSLLPRKAAMETLERIIAEHPFFAGLESYYTSLLTGCASNVRFNAGTYIFKEGEEANEFYLIRAARWRWRSLRRSASRSWWRPWARERFWAGRGCCRPTSGSSTRTPSESACDCPRRQVPAHEMRGEPRSRL